MYNSYGEKILSYQWRFRWISMVFLWFIFIGYVVFAITFIIIFYHMAKAGQLFAADNLLKFIMSIFVFVFVFIIWRFLMITTNYRIIFAVCFNEDKVIIKTRAKIYQVRKINKIVTSYMGEMLIFHCELVNNKTVKFRAPIVLFEQKKIPLFTKARQVNVIDYAFLDKLPVEYRNYQRKY